MRRRRQHHLIAWTVPWAVVGALFALATDARAQFGATAVYNTTNGNADTIRITWDYSANANIPDGSYSATVTMVMSGSPGSCSGSATWHPGITKSGGVITPSCADCQAGTTYIEQGGVTSAMPCYSGGTRTYTVANTSSGGVSISGTGGTITRQDQASGGGGLVIGNVHLQFGSATCTSPVTVTAHWQGGAPHAAGVVVNAVVGGFLAQIQCDANGCNSGSIPAAMLNLTGSSPWAVDAGVDTRSWAICGVEGSRYQTSVTMVSAPSTVACGGTVDIGISANCVQPTPTPSPSASVAPSPSTTPVITPPPSPSSTPLQYITPPPNAPGTGVTNGGTTMSGITNQDIYNDVKQALDDAGNRDSDYIVPNSGFGFGSDPGGENGSAGNGLQSAVDRFTNDLSGSGDGLMEKVDAIDSLTLPTSIGDKSSWAVSLPVLGDLTIDLSTFDGPVGTFRSLCLAILVVGAWFAMIKIIRSGVA